MSSELRLPKIPRHEKTIALRVVAAVLGFIVRMSFKIKTEGLEQLPKQGPYILVGNHMSYVDPLAMAYLVYYRLKRAPHFLAKEALFRIPVFGSLILHLGQIPVFRTGRSNDEPLKAAKRFLEAGHTLIVFPEGTLTRDPDLWPMRGRSGAIRLAIDSKVPVFPVGHWGCQEVLGNYSSKFRPNPFKVVTMKVGPEVDFSDLHGKTLSAEILGEATNRAMSAVAGLVGELRGETPPLKLWDPASAGQSATGNFRRPEKK